MPERNPSISWIKGERAFFSNSPVLPTLQSIVMEVKLVENIFYGHSSVSSDTNNMQATLSTLSLAKGTSMYPKPVPLTEVKFNAKR